MILQLLLCECVCVCVRGRGWLGSGLGWGLDAPAYLSAKSGQERKNPATLCAPPQFGNYDAKVECGNGDKRKQVRQGHNIIVDGWGGAYHSHPYPPLPQAHSHTQSHNRNIINAGFHTLDISIPDCFLLDHHGQTDRRTNKWTNGWTKPPIVWSLI